MAAAKGKETPTGLSSGATPAPGGKFTKVMPVSAATRRARGPKRSAWASNNKKGERPKKSKFSGRKKRPKPKEVADA